LETFGQLDRPIPVLSTKSTNPLGWDRAGRFTCSAGNRAFANRYSLSRISFVLAKKLQKKKNHCSFRASCQFFFSGIAEVLNERHCCARRKIVQVEWRS
jgi:hypothetical protein